jgi:hypothetical protein
MNALRFARMVAVISSLGAGTPWAYGGEVIQGVDGPVLYKQVSDGPFSCVNFLTFQVEDFEDHLLNTPGLGVTSGFITSSVFDSARDSVDLDDGDLNNLSTNNAGTYQGDSWYVQVTVSFTFDPRVLGGFPTHAGLVITDATFGAETVTGFDAEGQPVGSLVYEFPDPGEGSCADDYFYGAFSQNGISRIEVVLRGETEIDHVQYGFSDLAAESDLNDDGVVDGADLGILLSNWDTPCLGDLNGDFTVDGADLGVLLSNWR